MRHLKNVYAFFSCSWHLCPEKMLWCVLFQIYTHLNNVFELLSKAVVESKQKVNIPKLNKEEPEEKEESEKPKKEERGIGLRFCFRTFSQFLH